MTFTALARTFVVAAAFAAPLGACASSDMAAPPAVAEAATLQDSARAHRADAAIQAALADGPFPGIAVAVARDGRVIYARGAGLADRETGQPVNAETRFPVGSITKPITCLAVHQLITQGKIDPEAPAGAYLPNLPAPSRDVRVRYLLDHSSGTQNYLENREFPYARPVGLTRQDMLGYFAALPLRYPAGTQFNYSNSNTFLLGLIIEAVSGQGYDAYVRDHVFAPFGMARSDFAAARGAEADRALGYDSRGGEYRPGVAYDWIAPFSAGAVVSTAGDMVRFADGVFGAGADAALRARLLEQGRLADGSLNAYAQGCFIAGDLDDRRRYSHPGSIYGFSSHLAHYPDDGLTVVVLTNSQGENFPALTLEHQVARIFLDLPEPDLSQRPLAAADLERMAGDYVITNRRLGFDRLGFVARDGILNLSYGGAASGVPLVPLVHVGEGRFVSSRDPEQRFRFTRDADGSTVLRLDYYDAVFPLRRAD